MALSRIEKILGSVAVLGGLGFVALIVGGEYVKNRADYIERTEPTAVTLYDVGNKIRSVGDEIGRSKQYTESRTVINLLERKLKELEQEQNSLTPAQGIREMAAEYNAKRRLLDRRRYVFGTSTVLVAVGLGCGIFAYMQRKDKEQDSADDTLPQLETPNT